MASAGASPLALPLPSPDHRQRSGDDDESSVFHENDINKMAKAEITLGCGGRNYSHADELASVSVPPLAPGDSIDCRADNGMALGHCFDAISRSQSSE